MRDLRDFSVPNDGEVPVCEINGRMQCMGVDFTNLSVFTTSIDKHPKIHITRDLLHPVGLGDEGRSLFLPTDVPFLKQLTQVYIEQGLEEALQTATYHENLLINSSAKILSTFLKYLYKIQEIIHPHIQYKSIELINEFSQTRNWCNNSIRCLAWHPHTSKIAVATCDDSIRIYSNDNTFVPLLRCKQQKNITALAWRPMSGTEIAVGHENGIIIWNIDFNSLVTRPSMSNTIILERPDHKPIISLAWSPRGDLLISASARQSNLVVWDVELNRTTHLKGSREPGNVLLKWSPSKNKLLSVSDGVVFRIWNCRNWESERWTITSGRVQSACWVNNGANLLFATTTETLIYGLNVRSDFVFAKSQETSANHASPLFDLAKLDLDGFGVGGLVQCMESDPKGNHLTVMFKDTNCVAIFSVTKAPTFQLIPSSLITGYAAEIPSSIAFQQNFKAGACLTIGWSSGRVQHFPIVYSDLENELETNTV